MARKIDIVLGSHYGDEGKGATVHRITKENTARGLETVVIKANGGSQCGHTVELETGYRRVFSTLGSGTLAGAETLLSRYFLLNPVYFQIEFLGYFNNLGPTGKKYTLPFVTIQLEASVVTFYDVAHNQFQEVGRGSPHGSCGHGIGATRSRPFDTDISVKDLLKGDDHIQNKLARVRRYYKTIETQVIRKDREEEEIVRFLKAAEFIRGHCRFCNDWGPEENQALIFEHGQGLLLDAENKEHFPHVTHSKTTSLNSTSFIYCLLDEPEWDKPEITLNFCSRPYITRHGNGPMIGLTQFEPRIDGPWNIVDRTNIHNRWQGDLRFAEIDFSKFEERVRHELAEVPKYLHNGKVEANISVICMDQVSDPIRKTALTAAFNNLASCVGGKVTFFDGRAG